MQIFDLVDFLFFKFSQTSDDAFAKYGRVVCMLLFKGIPKVNQEDGLTFDQIRRDLKKLTSSKCFKHKFPDATDDYSSLKSAALDSRCGHYHIFTIALPIFH